MRCKCGFDTNIAVKLIQVDAERTKWKCPECLEWSDYKEQAACEQSELNDGLSCDCCGGKMVYIRGRHPGMDNRLVCPTCMAETLDDIKGRLRTNYGQAEQGAR